MDDTISRAAAIEAVRQLVIAGWGTDHGVMDSDVIYETLEELPSAQPEIIRCKDCKWFKLSSYNTLGIHICQKFSGVRGEHDFCSRGERREDETD